LNFLIVAWVLFLPIKAINQLKKEEAPRPAPWPDFVGPDAHGNPRSAQGSPRI